MGQKECVYILMVMLGLTKLVLLGLPVYDGQSSVNTVIKVAQMLPQALRFAQVEFKHGSAILIWHNEQTVRWSTKLYGNAAD